MSEKLSFCDNCPRLPSGVVAEVVEVRKVTRADVNMSRHTGEPLDAGDGLGNVVLIRFVAVEGTDPSVAQVGDEAYLKVSTEGKTKEEIEEAVRNCLGPKKTIAAKALGSKGKCQAVRAL